jgi:hypothetical protein
MCILSHNATNKTKVILHRLPIFGLGANKTREHYIVVPDIFLSIPILYTYKK